MNVLLDFMATQPRGSLFHGGGEFAKRIFFELLKNKNKENRYFAVFDHGFPYPTDVVEMCLNHNIEVIYIRNKKEIEKIFIDKSINILFIGIVNPMFFIKIPADIKIVFTCHDMRPLELSADKSGNYPINNQSYIKSLTSFCKMFIKKILPDFIYKKYFAYFVINKWRNLLNRSDVVITDSHYSRRAILNQFSTIDVTKIKVLLPPKKLDVYIDKTVTKNDKKYFLLISTDRYEKNAYRAIQALDRIISKFQLADYYVVCTGNTSQKIRRSIINGDYFEFKGYVSAEELECLYKNAYAFIYPTLYEGFGFPPLEAMKYGTIVLASNVTAVPEICGNAAIYFNPYSIEEIENKLLYVIYENVYFYKDRAIKRYNEILEIQEESLKKIINLINGISKNV